MDAVAALTRLGGVGSAADVLELTTRRKLQTAVERGDVERVTRSRYARRVGKYADARAANPFESVLRAIVLESGVLDVVPQVPIETRTMTFEPDLVDVRRRVVVEADSWSFHRDQTTHGRDCVRHTALAVAGYQVLRFSWEQVMQPAPYVRAVLEDLSQTTCGGAAS